MGEHEAAGSETPVERSRFFKTFLPNPFSHLVPTDIARSDGSAGKCKSSQERYENEFLGISFENCIIQT